MTRAPQPTTLPVVPPHQATGTPAPPPSAGAAAEPPERPGQGGSSGGMRVAIALLGVLGFVAVIAGALALITQSDTGELISDDTEELDTGDDADGELGLPDFPDADLPFDQLPDADLPFDQLPDADIPFDQLPGSLPGDLPGDIPFDQLPDSLPEGALPEGLTPGDLPELSGEQAADFLGQLQNQFDQGRAIPLDQLGAPGITAQQDANGVTTLRGPNGEPIHIVPEGSPAGDVPDGQRERALKPSPNGEFGGVEVDDDGQLVPVPRGEETEDTLRFDFGERGVNGLDPSNLDGPGLDISPTRPGAPSDGVESSDPLQEELEADGSITVDIAGREVKVERLPNGIYKMTSPEGDEIYFDPYGGNRGVPGEPPPELPPGLEGNLFVPGQGPGQFSGFRIDENGEFQPVPRGEPTDDMFNFGFGQNGAADSLMLPGEQAPIEIPQSGRGGSLGGGLGLRPDQAAPGIELEPPPASGDVLTPDQLRAEAQQRFDAGTATPVDPEADDGITAQALPDGSVELRGPDGTPLYILPEGVPGSDVPDSQRARALKPAPDGDIIGVEIDENGQVVPVPRGEETEDTLRFEFGEGGVTGLDPGDAELPSIEITPTRPGAFGGGGGVEIPPELAEGITRDQAQSELEEQGSTTFDFGGVPVDVEQLDNGDLRFTTPNGESIEVDPDGALDGKEPIDPDGKISPAPESVEGLGIGPDGSLTPLGPGAEPQESLDFNFDEDGNVSGLDLPGDDTGDLEIPELQDNAEATEPLGGDLDVEPEDADPAFARRNGTSRLGLALVAVGIVTLGIAAGLLLWRRGREPEGSPEVNEEQASAATVADEEARRAALRQQYVVNQTVESLSDQLRREPDPRQAILRAYSVIEAGVGGVSRQSAESHKSYLHRVLGNNAHHEHALTQLTDLFELARYSNYPVTEEMRTAAIASLESVRNQPGSNVAEPATVGW